MTKRPNSSRRRPTEAAGDGPPLLLKTGKEVREYLAAHLTPVRRGPKGQPIYAQKDIEKLNVIFYPDA
ncbi:MAG: hypothetical protein NTW87_26520 [Planctomycetota bacterium]|nr:hypothetical protein [Planctomycetota bacterium]